MLSESKFAVVVIDMQVALVEAAYKADRVLDRLENLLVRAREVGVPIVHVQHDHDSFEALKRGTPTWQIHPSVAPHAGEPVISKRTSDAFHATELEEVLRVQSVATVAIAGMQTEYCVDTTCRSALRLGFGCILLLDAHTTSDATLPAQEIIRHHNHVLSTLAYPNGGVRLMSTSQFSIEVLRSEA
jgi:nicotinamidase-related amidase